MVRVGCAGILVKDTFCGPLKSLPGEGELLCIDAMPIKAGGCAANVAINLSKQNVNASLAGMLGEDAAADALEATFALHGIDCGQISRTESYPTSETLILLIEGEDRRYIHSFGANQAFTVEHISRNWLESLTVFYLGGLFALPSIRMDALVELCRFCRSKSIVTVLDVVVPAHFTGTNALKHLLPYVDWFLPNDDEASKFTGHGDPLQAIQVLQRWGAKNLVVTLGKSGAVAVQDDKYWQCGAYAWDARDPSGSGDAFTSGIITGIVHGWDVPKMLQFASALGASATRAIGTTDSVFSLAEAQQLVATDPVGISTGFSTL